MQDRTPGTAASDNPTSQVGLSGMSDEQLSALIRTAYEQGQSFVMDAPAVPIAEAARQMPTRIAAGIRWLLANPAASIPEDDPVLMVSAVAYYSGVRSTVDQFMQVPKIQREVADLFATASVPGQRSRTDESGS